MRYYQLVQDERMTNPVVPVGITSIPEAMLTRERLHELDDWLLQFEVREQPSGGTYLDFIERPVSLWSDKLKHHLQKCSSKLKVQPVVLTDLKRFKQEEYWIVLPPVVPCVSEMSQFRKDGTLQKLVIQDDQVKHPIFKVGGILEELIIINLAIAESLLRRGFRGMKLLRIESESSLDRRNCG